MDQFEKKLNQEKMKSSAKMSATQQLGAIIEAGKRELGYMDHGLADSPVRTVKPAATGGTLDLRELTLDVQFKRDNTRSLLAGTEAGAVYDLPTKIAEASRVCSFGGAKLIVAADPPPASPGPIIAWSQTAGALVNVESASFSAVADGDDTSSTALSAFIHSANIVWPDAPSHGFSCTVTRRDQKDHGYDVAQAVMDAIVLGIGRLADDVLLSAIVTARTGEAFTMAKAAAQGLKHGELRCIGGTLTGTGLSIDGGQLFYRNVLAEMTDTFADDVFGSFARSGVALHPSLRIAVKRLNVNGDMQLDCFCNALPLVPNPAVFWVG